MEDDLKSLLRHRIHYLLSVEVGIQRADGLYPEIDALLDDLADAILAWVNDPGAGT